MPLPDRTPIFDKIFFVNATEINKSVNYNYSFEWLPLSCASPKKFTQLKVILLGIATAVAFAGVLANLIIFFLFARKPRQPILTLLALLDCFLCLSYIALFGNEALGNYFQIKMAYDALFEYLSTIYVLSKVVQLCIPLMLIAASMVKWAFLANKKFGIWR